MATANIATPQTAQSATIIPVIPAKDKAAAKPKAAAKKDKPVNPISEARRGMLGKVREERSSLTDCLRLLGMFGAGWIKAIGLQPKQVAKLTPNDLRPFQRESERYRAAIADNGELSKIEVGWSPSKVAAAIERYAAAQIESAKVGAAK